MNNPVMKLKSLKLDEKKYRNNPDDIWCALAFSTFITSAAVLLSLNFVKQVCELTLPILMTFRFEKSWKRSLLLSFLNVMHCIASLPNNFN